MCLPTLLRICSWSVDRRTRCYRGSSIYFQKLLIAKIIMRRNFPQSKMFAETGGYDPNLQRLQKATIQNLMIFSGRGGSSAMSSAEGLGGISEFCRIEELPPSKIPKPINNVSKPLPKRSRSPIPYSDFIIS